MTLAMLKDLLDLTKPRLSSMVVITTGFGALLAPGWTAVPYIQLIALILGSTLIVAAANTFNCIIEKDTDLLMERTHNRPLPQKRLKVSEATIFGLGLLILAIIILAKFTNNLALSLALIGFGSYVFLYTPLKRFSSTALYVGAIPGAIPPMIGFAGVAGRLDVAAWILFWILFFWQLPHFIAISLFRFDDYKNAGLKTLPGQFGRDSAQGQMLLYTGGLVIASFAPYFAGLAGVVYLACALLVGIGFATVCVAGFFDEQKINWSRVVFLGSLAYLPIVLGIWALDRWMTTIGF
jgi:protoheme IX farnesyltransferase